MYQKHLCPGKLISYVSTEESMRKSSPTRAVFILPFSLFLCPSSSSLSSSSDIFCVNRMINESTHEDKTFTCQSRPHSFFHLLLPLSSSTSLLVHPLPPSHVHNVTGLSCLDIFLRHPTHWRWLPRWSTFDNQHNVMPPDTSYDVLTELWSGSQNFMAQGTIHLFFNSNLYHHSTLSMGVRWVSLGVREFGRRDRERVGEGRWRKAWEKQKKR